MCNDLRSTGRRTCRPFAFPNIAFAFVRRRLPVLTLVGHDEDRIDVWQLVFPLEFHERELHRARPVLVVGCRTDEEHGTIDNLRGDTKAI